MIQLALLLGLPAHLRLDYEATLQMAREARDLQVKWQALIDLGFLLAPLEKPFRTASDTNSQSVVERMVASLVFIPSLNLFLNRLRPILQHIKWIATWVWKLLPRRSCLFRAPFTALGTSLRLERRQPDRTWRRV